jgi:DNA polymerase-3 subunit alpha
VTWIPLHVHSHWSLLDGVPSVPELVDFAKTAGLPALALTDTNALYGAVDFVVRCRKAGIRSIIGAELSLEGDRSAVFLARNRTGYGNLCRLVTLLQARPDREEALARGLALPDLAAHTEGLIALAAGAAADRDKLCRSRIQHPPTGSGGRIVPCGPLPIRGVNHDRPISDFPFR